MVMGHGQLEIELLVKKQQHYGPNQDMDMTGYCSEYDQVYTEIQRIVT